MKWVCLVVWLISFIAGQHGVEAPVALEGVSTMNATWLADHVSQEKTEGACVSALIANQIRDAALNDESPCMTEGCLSHLVSGCMFDQGERSQLLLD